MQHKRLKYAVLGNGSFATALTKVLSDNKHEINWWMRSEAAKEHLQYQHHNPHYLSQVYFNDKKIKFTTAINLAIKDCDVVLLGIPSAFLKEVVANIDQEVIKDKIIVSAIKGIIPIDNLLINEYLYQQFGIKDEQYCCITGPCHAEEVAAEKLSYLTYSSTNKSLAEKIASDFETSYLKSIVNQDVYGVQFAAILKNIYALGAGIAHGLDYGDNFLSVYNTNCFNEMENFITAIAQQKQQLNTPHHYNSGAYLGDLLVTSYSLHSRNRRFGNMIGRGYSVASARLELNMVAEGYYAANCINEINQNVTAHIPIVEHIYNILWKGMPAKQEFKLIEQQLK
jgi:glycerol-3-phosphate dehydrogenase (NAD(P)+)